MTHEQPAAGPTRIDGVDRGPFPDRVPLDWLDVVNAAAAIDEVLASAPLTPVNRARFAAVSEVLRGAAG